MDKIQAKELKMQKKLARAQRKKERDDEEREFSMVEHPGVKDIIIDVVVVLVLLIVALCSIIPLWDVLMLSFTEGFTAFISTGLALWFKGSFSVEGWKDLFEYNQIWRGYLNTILYTILSTALGWFISITAGYAMSRNTKLKRFMVLFVMITMLFGGGMIPTYMVVQSLGMINTPLAVIIPGCSNAMFCIMMMNAFAQVPPEMYEAARMDGAGQFATMWKIMLPQVGNMSAVIILNCVVGVWNSWFNASIYLPTATDWWPLQLVIKNITSYADDYVNQGNYSYYLVQYCAIIASILPIIVLFPFFQKKMEKAQITGGVKG